MTTKQEVIEDILDHTVRQKESDGILSYRLTPKDGSNPEWESLPELPAGDSYTGIYRLNVDSIKGPIPLWAYTNDSEYIEHYHSIILNSTATFNDVNKKSISINREIKAGAPVGDDDSVGITAYVDTSLGIALSGSIALPLTSSESKQLKVVSYNCSSNYRYFDDLFTALSAFSGIQAPGVTDKHYVIFPALCNDGKIRYIICSSNTSFEISNEDTIVLGEGANQVVLTQVGQPRLISVGSEDNPTKIPFGNGLFYNLSQVLIDDNKVSSESDVWILNKCKVDGNEYNMDIDLNNIFNATYVIPENVLIEDPTDPHSYFNENHPVNRYCLAKFDETISDIRISPLSISR